VTRSIKFVSITLLIVCYQQGNCQNWLPLNNGIGCDFIGLSQIRSIYADNEEGLIYMNGDLFYAENGIYENCEFRTSGTAVWDGKRFTNLNGGQYYQQGTLITKYKGKIYASAPIFSSSDIAFGRWNGVGWDSLVGAPNGRVTNSKIIDNELWIGGWFNQCGNQNCQQLAKFDGENYYPLNNEFPIEFENYIASIEFSKDTIYVAGDFTNYGANSDDSIFNFAKFYNNRMYGVKPYFTSSTAINPGCMVNYKNELYLGGYIIFSGDDTVHRLLKYDGEKFSRVGSPDMQMNQQPQKMMVYNNELYILGLFDKLGEQSAQHLVKWDGEKYTILNTDTAYTKNGSIISYVNDFAILNDTLYMGGDFYRIGNDTMRYIAKLNRALSDPIPPPAENNLILYPNPAVNEVTIGYSINSLQNVNFGIYDLRGRLIKKIEKGKKQPGKYILEKIDISKLANGIYFVQMQTDKESIVKKLVKD
jgi:Secretion system C-terminal sorting domain